MIVLPTLPITVTDKVADKLVSMDNLGIEFPLEIYDVLDIFIMGAAKHGANSYLEPDVFTFEKRTPSQFRHLMKKTGLWYMSQNGDTQLLSAIELVISRLKQTRYDSRYRLDEESGLPHELHEICNALIFYITIERGIIHE